jgi:threonine/homoserine/homoserine lactone efflux protein
LIGILLFIITSFAVGLSGALVPGPMLTVTISDSLKRGFIAGPLIVIGHYIAELALILLIFAGIGWLFESSTAIFLIGTLGGIMMLLMGFRITRSSNSLNELKENNGIKKDYGPILSGFFTSVSNPFFFIWWATIGWAFIIKGIEIAGIVGVLGFLVGHWASDLSWFSGVSFFTSRGSQIITEKHYKFIMNISGIFLMLLGIYFLLNAQKII